MLNVNKTNLATQLNNIGPTDLLSEQKNIPKFYHEIIFEKL